MMRVISSLLTAGVIALVAGCSEAADEEVAGSVATATAEISSPLDEDELLNSLDDVRSMVVEAAAGIDPESIEEVRYDDGTLKLTLSAGDDLSDTAAMQRRCNEIGSAVALPELRIVLQGPDGATVAECTFS